VQLIDVRCHRCDGHLDLLRLARLRRHRDDGAGAQRGAHVGEQRHDVGGVGGAVTARVHHVLEVVARQLHRVVALRAARVLPVDVHAVCGDRASTSCGWKRLVAPTLTPAIAPAPTLYCAMAALTLAMKVARLAAVEAMALK